MPHHSTQIVDKIPSNEFRRRFSHYVGRLKDDGDVLIIRRGRDDQVYLVTEADWSLIEQALSETRDGSPFALHMAQRLELFLHLPGRILGSVSELFCRLANRLRYLFDILFDRT